MGLWESIKLAFEGLRTNKMRSFLTALGIIIGIGSVIGIMTLGSALTNSVSSAFDSISNGAMYFYISPKDSDQYYNAPTDQMFTRDMLNAMEQRFAQDIEAVGITVEGSGSIQDRDKEASIYLTASNPGVLRTSNVKMITGNFITEKDDLSRRQIAVISDVAAKKFFGETLSDALGKEITVHINDDIQVFSISGIYNYENVNVGPFGGGGNQDDPTTALYIPLSIGDTLFKTDGTYSTFMVVASDGDRSLTLDKDIENFFNTTYYAERDYQVNSQSARTVMEEINSTMQNVSLAIGGIAAISLLVGGIGVMNILLVSVTERTREIGIRKALGATNNDIRRQFIVESIIICIFGGILGILLGGAIGYGGSKLMKSPTLPSLFSIFIAVGFSMAIGIFFGYYPANKAAKLNPIDALRYK